MFDEFKINRLLKSNMTGNIYISLSTNFQIDKRIVEHLIKCSPQDIGVVNNSVDVSEYVLNNPELLNYLNAYQLNKIFPKLDLSKVTITKELFDALSDKNQKIAIKQYPTIFINYFDNKTKLEILKEYALSKYAWFHSRIHGASELFTDEDFEQMILSLSSNELYEILSSKAISEDIIKIISKLDVEKIIRLSQSNPELIKLWPDEIKERIDIYCAGDNLGKIYQLNKESQAKIALKNPHLIPALDDDVVDEYMERVETISSIDFVRLRYNSKINYLKKMPFDERKKLFKGNFENVYYIASSSHDEDLLEELVLSSLNEIEDSDKKDRLTKLFKSLTTKEVFNDPYFYHRENYQISKLLFDKQVVNNNEAELLEKYKETLDKDLLIEILVNAYGEHVREVFASRPQLDLIHFNNLSLLDKKIYDVLGIGFVNYALTCDLRQYNYLIYQMAEDEKVLHNFKKFIEIMYEDIDRVDINFLTDCIENFLLYEDVLMNVDFDSLSPEMKENIKTYVNDTKEVGVFVRNIEDLENYEDIREKRYADMIYDSKKRKTKKDAIFAYLTNRDIFDSHYGSKVEKLCLEQVIKAFDIDEIINNEELIEKIGLNKDEIAILLLLNEINNISDEKTLIKTFESIKENGLDFRMTKSILRKIRNYSTEDLKNNLISSDKLDAMNSEEIDGVKVVSFDGEDFTMLVSTIGMNINSGKFFAKRPEPERLLKDWLGREFGVNSISTALVSSDTSIYPLASKNVLDKYILFAFGDDIDINGMGASDISSDHVPKNSRHSFNYMMENKFKFTDTEKLKHELNYGERDAFSMEKFLSEISISRYREDIRNEDSFKRVMPIGIYVTGEITDEILEIAKVFNEYYKEHGLGEFRIIKVNSKVYKNHASYINSSKKGEEYGGRSI